jgi:hypothetical protein
MHAPHAMRTIAVGFATAIPILWLTALPVTGQTPGAASQRTPPAKNAVAAKKMLALRTPWGDPDLQGVWNNAR